MRESDNILMTLYRSMLEIFGNRAWWPGQGRLEICVGAILTQNTNWSNVAKAITNLKKNNCLDFDKLDNLSCQNLAELIRPAGYYNLKATRLKNFIHCIATRWDRNLDRLFDRPVAEIRLELLSVNGIGPETADSIILYAGEKLSFVVDAYTIRIFQRHGIIRGDEGYEAIREYCQSVLPQDVGLWNDFHAQIVETGKHYCKTKPQCNGCPLEDFYREISP